MAILIAYGQAGGGGIELKKQNSHLPKQTELKLFLFNCLPTATPNPPKELKRLFKFSIYSKNNLKEFLQKCLPTSNLQFIRQLACSVVIGSYLYNS